MNIQTTDSVFALSVENLTVAYDKVPVLYNITVQIRQRSLVGIVGPNGGGKTTFIKTILGMIAPIAGTIKIFGIPIARAQHSIAYVPQRSSVDWDFPINVLDVVLMGCYNRLGWFKRPPRIEVDRALRALAQVNLEQYAYHHIGQLSGGQQQRVFLARAFMQDAAIYLLDEPFNAVDITTERIIISLLKELCSQGKTVVVVHHNLSTVSHYFDWLLLLNRTCIAFGPSSEINTHEYMKAVYQDQALFNDQVL
jgi:manganese/zinc/iron transport system ATP- binding protein